MASEELRHFQCVFGMRAHAPWQGAYAAQNQPAIKRRGDRAALVLNAADALKKFVVCFRHDDSAGHVAVAAEIFRGRIKNEIGPNSKGRWSTGAQVLSQTHNAPAS